MGKGKVQRTQAKKQGRGQPENVPQNKQNPQLTQRELKKQERNTRNRMRQERNMRRYGDKEWIDDFAKFQEQMKPLGLCVKDVAGDGNCLFRAIADQMEGDPNKYAPYRKKICEFIEKNRFEYEPFIEDDETFEDYIKEMKTDGTWGGQMEIQAASLVYMINITIHQLAQPRWEIVNFPTDVTKTIHLSYHLGAHYSSVRLLNDPTTHARVPNAPPKEIKIVDKSKPKLQPYQAPETKKEELILSDDEFMIMEVTGCKNKKFVHQLFIENFGNMQACVDFILMIGPDDSEFQRQFLEDSVVKSAPKQSHTSNSNSRPSVQEENFVHPKLQKYYQPTPKERKEQAKKEKQQRNAAKQQYEDDDTIHVTSDIATDLGSMQL